MVLVSDMIRTPTLFQRRISLYILGQEVDFSPKTNGQDIFVSQNVSIVYTKSYSPFVVA